jgi:hypothetical protein
VKIPLLFTSLRVGRFGSYGGRTRALPPFLFSSAATFRCQLLQSRSAPRKTVFSPEGSSPTRDRPRVYRMNLPFAASAMPNSRCMRRGARQGKRSQASPGSLPASEFLQRLDRVYDAFKFLPPPDWLATSTAPQSERIRDHTSQDVIPKLNPMRTLLRRRVRAARRHG